MRKLDRKKIVADAKEMMADPEFLEEYRVGEAAGGDKVTRITDQLLRDRSCQVDYDSDQ